MPSSPAIRLRLSLGRSSSLMADKPWERNIAYQKSFIPYGGYWSTPFAKWQGSFANLHAVRFAAHVAKAELAKRKIPAAVFDHAIFGTTAPQRSSFYGLPWLMSMIGNSNVGGTVVS